MSDEYNAMLCAIVSAILMMRFRYAFVSPMIVFTPYLVYKAAIGNPEVFAWVVVVPIFFGLIFMLNISEERLNDHGMYALCLVFIITSLPTGVFYAVLIVSALVVMFVSVSLLIH